METALIIGAFCVAAVGGGLLGVGIAFPRAYKEGFEDGWNSNNTFSEVLDEGLVLKEVREALGHVPLA